jgi:hypothetical protein
MTSTITVHEPFYLVTTVMPQHDHEKELAEHAELLDVVTNNTPINFIKAFTIPNTATGEIIHTAYCGRDATPAKELC